MNIYNMINQINISAYEFSHNEKTNKYYIERIAGLGIIPNLNFKIEF